MHSRVDCCTAGHRGHYNIGQLTPGKTEDLWIDIGVPTKQGQKENNTSTTRDKVVGAMVGAKGSHPKDVEGTAAHIQVSAGALSSICSAHAMLGMRRGLKQVKHCNLIVLVLWMTSLTAAVLQAANCCGSHVCHFDIKTLLECTIYRKPQANAEPCGQFLN